MQVCIQACIYTKEETFSISQQIEFKLLGREIIMMMKSYDDD